MTCHNCHLCLYTDHILPLSISIGIISKIANAVQLKTQMLDENVLPGHSADLQSSSSIEFPGHCWFPPEAGSLHVRALTLDPGPQEAVHWDHWAHSCCGCNFMRLIFFVFALLYQWWLKLLKPGHGAVLVLSPTQSLPPNRGDVHARARIFLADKQFSNNISNNIQ